MLKELRAKRLDDVYRALLESLAKKPGYPRNILEHPALSQLFEDLVNKGDFDATERHIENIIDEGLCQRSTAGLDNVSIKPIQLVDGGLAPPSRQHFGLANQGQELYLFGGSQ